MTNRLHIDASARPGLGEIDPHGSYSRRLSHDFISQGLSREPPAQVSSRGDHEHMNHLHPAIKTALGFVGLHDFHSIAVEHQSQGGELFDRSLRYALSATT
jgi:hypothetical protein